jgi:hypothetical protein
MKSIQKFAIMLIASALFLSCTKSLQDESSLSKNLFLTGKAKQDEKFNTFYGPQVSLGNGKVRTFVTISHSNVPAEVGVIITKGALTGLPAEGVNLVLPMQNHASDATPFTHVYLDWNPNGHEPGPYKVPHFDFHFYMISSKDRMAISPSDPKMEQIPDPALWPVGYIPTPGGVPQMGKHWVSPGTSPELCCGQPFNYTLIYGTYAGKFIFTEPMITLAYLTSSQQLTKSFSPLKQFTVPNTYYPSTYQIRTDGTDRIVSLVNFTKH